MRLLTRSLNLLVLTGALGLAASATASATTATVQPAGTKAGLGTTAAKLTVHGGATITCADPRLRTTLASATGTLPLTVSTNDQHTFAGCTTASGAPAVTCTSTAAIKAVGLTVNGVTPLTVSSLSCTASISGCGSARITGSLPSSYDIGKDQLAVLVTGQSLAVSGSTCASIPNGTATLTNPTGGALAYTFIPITAISVY